MIGSSALLLFACSSLRHGLFQSNAWDLGIFDQPLYLLSRGLPPVSTIVGVHILGDHAAWIFYPLALLYWLYPDVHWLFLVQAISLAVAALPTWYLARQAGLGEKQAIAISASYLLYPLVFNLNLFDFHPEVIALPLILISIWAARAGQVGWFTVCIWIVLGCRDALSLTVIGMGAWLGLFEKRRWCGAIALVSGLVWFIIATKIILPHFQPAGILGLSYYAEFGKSIPEILLNLVLRPDLLLKRLLTLENLGYLLLLIAPLAWAIPFRSPLPPAPCPPASSPPAPCPLRLFLPLIAAIPQLALNLLSYHPAQKNLVHQYSLPILPFLLVVAIATLATGQSLLQQPRRIILWSLVAFFALAQFPLFAGRYLSTLDTWQASRRAIAQINTPGPVLAPAALVPHLSHRALIHVVAKPATTQLQRYDHLLFNLRHPGRLSTPEAVQQLINQAQENPQWQLRFHQDNVYLFSRLAN